jgi:hypothetical protein
MCGVRAASHPSTITSSPVQALHMSNRLVFYCALLLLEQPPSLGLDKSLLVHYYYSPDTVLNLLQRDRHLPPQNYDCQ